jgi:aminoglycoside phosphotransferase (APT) family kinase protein
MGLAMVGAAAAMSQVDVDADGIGNQGRREGYLERQSARWQSQLESYRELPGYTGSELSGVDAVAQWLDRNRPSTWQPGLVHGDFHLANVLFSPSGPELAAVVDWEMSTVGDPLLDLGWLRTTWPVDDRAAAILTIEPSSGFPTGDELVARYQDVSGRDLTALPWFEVLTAYKLGIVLEGTHARACAGLADKATGDYLHAAAVSLLEHAGELIAQN